MYVIEAGAMLQPAAPFPGAWQRMPVANGNHTVDDRPMLEISPHIKIPIEEFEFHFARSSGPGGQNVNKVSTKAFLRWNVVQSPALPEDVRQRFVEAYGSRLTSGGEIIIASDRFRSQRRNMDDCLRRLREMLASVARPPRRRKATRPTRAARERRLRQKQQQSEKKRRRRRPAED